MPPEEVIETVKSIWKREQNKVGSIEASPQDLILTGADLIARTEAYHKKGEEPALSTGWIKLDEFYRVRKKEWTLITGIPGAGKTTWLDNLCLNMAKNYHWKIAMFSAENVPHERHVIALSKMLGIDGDLDFGFIADHFAFLSPNEDALTLEKILTMCDTLAATWPFDALVIDPWNELDHMKRGNMSETEHVSAMLTKLRRYARMKNIHAWLIAHPTKLHKLEGTNRYPVPTPYDVSGSAHFRNKADNCLSLWWDYENKNYETQIHVQKIRFRECGQLGMVTLQHQIDGRYV
jgi:twinkle protein